MFDEQTEKELLRDIRDDVARIKYGRVLIEILVEGSNVIGFEIETKRRKHVTKRIETKL